MKKPLNDFAIQNITEKIENLEKLSSIEFVPVYAHKSESYWGLRTFWFGFFVYVSQSFLKQLWISNVLIAIIPLVIGIFVFWAFDRWSFLFDLLTLDRFVDRSVERAAREEFLASEIFATEKRTGVLIYISKLERKVFVLADKGLAKGTEQEEWVQLGSELAQAFSESKNVEATFCQALRKISEKHAKDFPPEINNKNELQNHPKFRK
jgi:putative membrane protein